MHLKIVYEKLFSIHEVQNISPGWNFEVRYDDKSNLDNINVDKSNNFSKQV